MLSRRGFAGFASCALCAITGFVASDASAQGTPPPATSTPGVKRKVLSQIDGPVPGYVTVVVEAEIEPGLPVAKHTHPGIESAYVIEGELDLVIGNEPVRTFKAGEGFQVPAGTVHGSDKGGRSKVKLTSTYVVEKGKPLATPA